VRFAKGFREVQAPQEVKDMELGAPTSWQKSMIRFKAEIITVFNGAHWLGKMVNNQL